MFNISIIIPVKNGAATLKKCLDAIQQQQYDGIIETLVLDSASIDNSVEIALQHGARVIHIPPEEFNHGLTRNVGITNATGELVYFTVQDAWLADVNNLQIMADHFKDIEVQSVTGMQAIPHDVDKNPALWFKRSSEPFFETFHFDAGTFSKLTGNKQLSFCRWDNVNSMYRKTALLSLPFSETNLSEDIIWAKQALEIGFKIIKDPALVVYHYHHQTFVYNFKVNYSVFYADKKIFGVLPNYSKVVLPLVRRFKTIIINRQISMWSKPLWILHNVGMYAAHVIAVTIFRTSFFLGNQTLLDRSLKYFCKQVPQGKLATHK